MQSGGTCGGSSNIFTVHLWRSHAYGIVWYVYRVSTCRHPDLSSTAYVFYTRTVDLKVNKLTDREYHAYSVYVYNSKKVLVDSACPGL